MSNEFIQVPNDILLTLGMKIISIHDDLIEHRGPESTEGMDSGDSQQEVIDAIGAFRDEWKASVFKLVDDINGWAGLTQSISQVVAEFDRSAAAQFCLPGLAEEWACSPDITQNGLAPHADQARRAEALAPPPDPSPAPSPSPAASPGGLKFTIPK